MTIIELSERPDLLQQGIQYFWKQWGSEQNLSFYQDCILHSVDKSNALPKFYLALEQAQIIGSYALLVNDIISRQDLMPWLACLYVEESHRKQGIAEQLLQHGLAQSKAKGFNYLYLSSDLVNFYERKGWQPLCDGYNVFGEAIQIYQKAVSAH
ncbi:MAG: GNAT family N-acetyltransferase [Bacteroidota bacterium]